MTSNAPQDGPIPEMHLHLLCPLIFAYLVGYFNFHFLFVLITFFVTVSFDGRVRHRLVNAYKKRVADEMRVEQFDLQHSVESVEWLNSIISSVWENQHSEWSQMIKASLQPILDSSRPAGIKAMELTQFELGSVPPVIEHFKTHKRKKVDNTLLLDVSLGLHTACRINITAKVGVLPLPCGANDFSLSGKLRIAITFSRNFPGVSHVSVAFVEKPQFDIVLKPLKAVNIMDIPGLSGWLNGIIEYVLCENLVLPKKIDIDVEKMMKPVAAPSPSSSGDSDEDEYEEEVQALGGKQEDGAIKASKKKKSKAYQLVVKLIDGKNLVARDSFLEGGKSDPFVIFKIGSQKLKSRVIEKTLNPLYNDYFELASFHPKKDKLKIEVFDWDRLGAAEPMGHYVLDIGDELGAGLQIQEDLPHINGAIPLQDSFLTEHICHLKGVESGQIRIAIGLFSPSCRVHVPAAAESHSSFANPVTFVMDGLGNGLGKVASVMTFRKKKTSVSHLEIPPQNSLPSSAAAAAPSSSAATAAANFFREARVTKHGAAKPSNDSPPAVSQVPFGSSVNSTPSLPASIPSSPILPASEFQSLTPLQLDSQSSSPAVVEEEQEDGDEEAEVEEQMHFASSNQQIVHSSAPSHDADSSLNITHAESDDDSDLSSMAATPTKPRTPMTALFGKKLRIDILCADGLRGVDSDGLSDPYVSIRIGETKHKTKVMKKSTSPKFMESLEFAITEKTPCVMDIKVQDWNRFKKSILLGSVHFSDFRDLVNTCNELHQPQWLELNEGVGKVCLSASIIM